MMEYFEYNDALAIEESLDPGPYVIKCQLEAPLSAGELALIKERLVDSGVILNSISQKGSVLTLNLIKPEPIDEGIAIFPFIAAIAILATLVIGIYSIYALPRILSALVPLTVILVGGYVIARTAPAALARRG